MFALTESLPAGGGGNPSEQNVSEAVDGRGRVYIGILSYQEYKIHCCAYSSTRLRRERLAAARSHSGENNTQLFSKTLVPLRYLSEGAYQICANIALSTVERTM